MDIKITGEVRDYVYKNGILIKEIKGHNLVLNSFNTLLLNLLNLNNHDSHNFDKSTSGFYFIIGSGKDSWDNELPAPEKSQGYLETPIGAVKADSFIVNSGTDEAYISYNANFPAGTLSGLWREFGIAYTLNSNITPVFIPKPYSPYATYYLLDKYHHPVIEKDIDISINRVLDFKIRLNPNRI